jgi:hypothetical protein
MDSDKEYKQGFLEGLQAACIMGESIMRIHAKNMLDKTLDESVKNSAMDACTSVGSFVSDIKGLAADVNRGHLDPKGIAKSNENYWWATEDGKGKN